jgi:hypothetical protein
MTFDERSEISQARSARTCRLGLVFAAALTALPLTKIDNGFN